MKYAKHRTHRKDDNHQNIASRFEDLHYSVFDTAAVGNGFPDIVVGAPGISVLTNLLDAKQLSIVLNNAGIHHYTMLDGVNILAEIKASAKAPFTSDEVEFQQWWRGQYDVFLNENEVDEITPWILK